ncbi:hypothetical protein JVT61DRAFT_4254 [Boletus reticuloceps]|uniref:Uncharacterized protein n=1 Tax=Boletus reticuloceps TaxID=495285 RepID=A0A8I2YNC5_9AGAM|nr:hypothetical protein JVT61DRAFT_4254 [Boletus reticuloceps]
MRALSRTRSFLERLLKPLNPGAESGKPVKGCVQEQAITKLAMVADASEITFAKVHVPQHQHCPFPHDYAPPAQHTPKRKRSEPSQVAKLRVKAIQCAVSAKAAVSVYGLW